jgi:hypothetical protein
MRDQTVRAARDFLKIFFLPSALRATLVSLPLFFLEVICIMLSPLSTGGAAAGCRPVDSVAPRPLARQGMPRD